MVARRKSSKGMPRTLPSMVVQDDVRVVPEGYEFCVCSVPAI